MRKSEARNKTNFPLGKCTKLNFPAAAECIRCFCSDANSSTLIGLLLEGSIACWPYIIIAATTCLRLKTLSRLVVLRREERIELLRRFKFDNTRNDKHETHTHFACRVHY